MSRYINADKYMSHLRANIDTTSDIIAEQVKKDKPIGTVADGGRIGYLNALQWARASLECDCYTVKAIPLDRIKEAREEIWKNVYEYSGTGEEVLEAYKRGFQDSLKIIDKLIESEESNDLHRQKGI